MLNNIIGALTVIIILVFSLVLHEIAHARVAYYLGDPTAKNMGRFSLNPLKHISYMSIILPITFILPITLFFINAPVFSFAKPVLYNDASFKNPKRDIIFVSLAGPFANFLLAIIAFAFYNKLSMLPDNILFPFNQFLVTMFVINVTLYAFNLLPIPPLDGSALYMSSIINYSRKLASKFNDYGLGVLISLLIVLPMAAGKKYDFIIIYLNWCYAKLITILTYIGL